MSAPSKLFDLTWVYPIPPDSSPRPVGLTGLNTIAPVDPGVPVVILYPSLMTPAIAVGTGKDAWVDVVLAFHGESLNKKIEGLERIPAIKAIINRQLKAHPGLNRAEETGAKSYSLNPLVVGADWADHIKILELGNLGSSVIDPAGDGDDAFKDFTFVGRLHDEAKKLYEPKGFKKIWALRFPTSALRALPATHAKEAVPKPGEAGADKRIAKIKDLDPDLILNNHPNHVVTAKSLPGEGRFAWRMAGDDFAAGDWDPANPIVLHHPVFHFAQLIHPSIGHMADLHVNSRQQIQRTNPAKVIPVLGEEISAVGPMVNIASRNTKKIFDAFAADAAVNVVVIGGDFVDFICNAVTAAPNHRLRETAKEVWDLVDMGASVDECVHYRDWVDFLGFFSLITDFYAKGGAKPVFAITGNHDCYYEPFGISPRIVVKEKGVVGAWEKKANEGIPADHNLTIYEAILSFGRTFKKLLTPLEFFNGRPGSSFLADKLSWVYTVFTPFSDFGVRTPGKNLVALGWGDSENMISRARADAQGLAHLPRADHCISPEQYALLETIVVARGGGRKTILTTHFTFASYVESISNADALVPMWGKETDQGDIYYTGKWYSTRDFSYTDMGTFEKKREIYPDILYGHGRVQVVLTGHSHRRGFYTLRKLDTKGNNSVKTGFHDFPKFMDGVPSHVDFNENLIPGGRTCAVPGKLPIGIADQKEPWIIVSDSGGSIPRMNLGGEFSGLGSDHAAGTRVIFDPATGHVAEMQPVRVGPKPRWVVALDYLDIIAGVTVLEKFETDEFEWGADYGPNWRYEFKVTLGEKVRDLTRYGMSIVGIDFYYPARPKPPLSRISLQQMGNDRWVIPADSAKMFRTRAAYDKTRRVFLALRFSSSCAHLQRYDFSSPWTFEVTVKEQRPLSFRRLVRYSLERDSEYREIPDFDRRETYEGF